ncbi:MAG: hypothetical protein ACE5JG_12615, partial [Planctomycetota bacterium]
MALRRATRHRLARLLGGLALVALGCVVFAVSAAHDPKNRAAGVAIVLILVGLSFFAQGLRRARGRHGQGTGATATDPPTGPVATGAAAGLPGGSTERTLVAV